MLCILFKSIRNNLRKDVIMKYLEINESKKIIGGGISVLGVLGIGSLITFIAGIIDGFARPLKCR